MVLWGKGAPGNSPVGSDQWELGVLAEAVLVEGLAEWKWRPPAKTSLYRRWGYKVTNGVGQLEAEVGSMCSGNSSPPSRCSGRGKEVAGPSPWPVWCPKRPHLYGEPPTSLRGR